MRDADRNRKVSYRGTFLGNVVAQKVQILLTPCGIHGQNAVGRRDPLSVCENSTPKGWYNPGFHRLPSNQITKFIICSYTAATMSLCASMMTSFYHLALNFTELQRPRRI